MDNEDDDLDYSNVPTESGPLPIPAWATVTKEDKAGLTNLREVNVKLPSKNDVIAQVWLFAINPRNKNEASKVRAMELVARLSGFEPRVGPQANPNGNENEKTDNLTLEEAKMVREAFSDHY